MPLAALAATTDCFNGPTWYDYRNTQLDISGKGTFDNPIVIRSAEDLAQLSWLVNEEGNSFTNKVISLEADIDLKKEADGKRVSWVPIGFSNTRQFYGIFLGCGTQNPKRHTIRGLYFDLVKSEYHHYAGLFGSAMAFIGYLDIKEADLRLSGGQSIDIGILVGSSKWDGGRQDPHAVECRETDGGAAYPLTAGIYSVSVEGALTTDGNDRLSSFGGIAGESMLSITHCTSKVTVRTTGQFYRIGGIVSIQKYETVIDCMAEVDIKGTGSNVQLMGGIVGLLENASVMGCSSTGTIENTPEGTFTLSGDGCGGIAGWADTGSKMLGCTSSLTMKTLGWMGGIVGSSNTFSGGNPYVDCCAYSGHLDATKAKGAGGIWGYVGSHAGQIINSCIFTGTIDRPADSKTCGAIMGQSGKPEEDAACCYYDIQMFNGQATGNITTHHTIKGVKTFDFTSGNLNVTPLLTIDTGDFGFTLKENFYPAVYYKGKWAGYDKMQKNRFSTTAARQLLGSDMNSNNSVSAPVQWMTTLPALLKSFDFANDCVATLTFNPITNQWEDKETKINFNMIASMQKPDADCFTGNENVLTAVKPGKCTVNFQVKTKNKSTHFSRPEALNASRQMMLVSTVGGIWDGTVGTACASGTGKAEDPYIIKNGAQLAYAISNNKEYEFYEQVCDIMLFKDRLADPARPNSTQNIWMSNSWNAPADDYKWKANYDGKGHYIKGAYIGGVDRGLFGSITSTGVVTNLGIVDSRGPRSGGLFAYEMNGIITNCIAQGWVGELHSMVSTYEQGKSGGFCSLVGSSNANAYIEDCISAVYSGTYSFEDFTPFVSLNTGNQGKVRHCLAVVPFSHLNSEGKNAGITASGKSYIQDCYWLKGYEEANSGQTLDEIQQQLGSRKLWECKKGYLPTLKSFAETDMAKMMMIPFRTDIDYTYDSELQESDNYLLGIGHQITFEPGTAKWTAVNDPKATYLETDTDMGVVVPVNSSYDANNSSGWGTSRELPGLVFVTGTLGNDKFPVPVRTRKGNVNAGFTFEDDYARMLCLQYFDDNHNKTLSLSELKAVTKERALQALQNPIAKAIKTFPEFRFFKNVTELTTHLNSLENLESIRLPYALQTIGKEAFKGCKNLKELIVSSKVVSVEGGAFYGSEVDSIFVDPFNTTFTSRDGVLFTKTNSLVAYPNGRTDAEATVAGVISSIAPGAFYQVPNLRRLFFDTTDYTTVPELADGAIVIDQSDPYRPDMMDVYVPDATYDRTLMTEYFDSDSWKPYAAAGKLHQYFPLKITEECGLAYPTASGSISSGNYVGTLYIGFPTQLPKGLKAYAVNAFNELEYKAYYHQKSQFIPALQPVIIMTTEPGTYRLTPIEGNLERWPVYANQLIGVARDGMRVNQSTSAQGSIMTLQPDENGRAAFLYEKKKEIEPYHCYLPFPTIDRPADVVRNAHYDLVFAEKATYETKYVGDYRFSVETLLPDNQRYAKLVGYDGPGGHLKVPAKLDDGTPVTQLGEHVFENARSSILSIDMTEMDNLEAFDGDRSDGTKPLGYLSQNTYVYLGGDKCTPGVNTILNDQCSELKLWEGQDFYAPNDFHADKVTYDRVLRATKNADGSWSSKAYTICVPYDIHFEDDENITFYELKAVTADYEYVFINCFNFINAGVPAVVVVKEGEYQLNVTDANVIGEPSEEIESTVYDTFEGSQDLTGTKVGDWRGTFRKFDNDAASARHMYGLASDGRWKVYSNRSEASRRGYIPPFRAFYEPLEFETNWIYDSKFVYTENGEDDNLTIQDFPADTFDGDIPDYDDETAIRPVIHTIDSDGTDRYYDLQGRPLNGKPNKGIYIYKGKKVIK